MNLELKHWLSAARPRTLSGAAVPVAVGCALAYSDGVFVWQAAVLCFVFAMLMQIAANFINDLGDYLKGSDTSERLGPPRACAEGWITPKAMFAGICITIAAACAAGCGLLFYGGWQMLFVGAGCVLFAALYTLLAYRGAGDVLVLLFFGLVPVGFTYYVMAGAWTASVTIAGAACGLVTDTLLTINNLRDREQDATAGKRTIVVAVGTKGGVALYTGLGVAAAVCCLLMLLEGRTWAALLPMLYLGAHIPSAVATARIDHGRELNRMLGRTSRNILLFGALLVLGILL